MLSSILISPALDAPATPIEDRQNRDSRIQRIRAFFSRRDCPAKRYAADFVSASDQYQLDWRLLPSLAMVESTGGKAYKNNNIFGWANCKRAFPTVKAGIHTVAERLANSPYYRGKSLDGKLHAYNSRPIYGKTVKRVMAQLASEPVY